MRGVVVAACMLGLLFAGCLEPQPPDRDPDLEVGGPLKRSVFDRPGDTFVVPEEAEFVTACFSFDGDDATFALGPHGVGKTFAIYQHRSEPFCVHQRDHLEDRDWRIWPESEHDGTYTARIWWR